MLKRYLFCLLSAIIVLSTLMILLPTAVLAAPALTLSPNSGFGGTTVTITVSGNGFAAGNSGFIWFDTDNDSLRDGDEPQIEVTTTGAGAVPSGSTLTTPVLGYSKTYRVRADVPSGGSIEASSVFTTPSTTTAVKITKLANDGTTVLGQLTVSYQWMQSSLPVLGDGATHYYFQGPVFVDDPDPDTQTMLRWNPEEDTNVFEKDMGALKGTNLKDLCNLVGGMSSGDTLKVKSSDGWNKTFAYKNVYQYTSREGPMALSWYKNGVYPDSPGGYGEGMRLVWFADDSVNPWGYHVFGNWDWHEASDSQYWYYFSQGGQNYPTTTGLSGQVVSELIIYSTLPPPPVAAFTADHTSGTAPLTVHFTDQSTNSPTNWAWDFDNNGTTDSSSQNPTFIFNSADTYTVKLTAANSGGSDAETKTGYIVVSPPAQNPFWDLNNDHICDIGDVVMLGLVWNQTGPGGWIPEDLNSEGIIDIGDVVVLGLHWNATW
jgi:hypothetical protein